MCVQKSREKKFIFISLTQTHLYARIRRMRKELLVRLKQDVHRTNIRQMAISIGIPYTSMYRIIIRNAGGHINTWDKIEAYYLKLDKKAKN